MSDQAQCLQINIPPSIKMIWHHSSTTFIQLFFRGAIPKPDYFQLHCFCSSFIKAGMLKFRLLSYIEITNVSFGKWWINPEQDFYCYMCHYTYFLTLIFVQYWTGFRRDRSAKYFNCLPMFSWCIISCI